MNTLPSEALLNIWYYNNREGNIILDEGARIMLRNLRTGFTKNPLVLYYRLCKNLVKVYTGDCPYPREGRPSIKVENEERIELSGGEYLGKITDDGSCSFSKELEDRLIPVSIMRPNTRPWSLYSVVYWTAYSVRTEDVSRARLYNLLWPMRNAPPFGTS